MQKKRVKTAKKCLNCGHSKKSHQTLPFYDKRGHNGFCQTCFYSNKVCIGFQDNEKFDWEKLIKI